MLIAASWLVAPQYRLRKRITIVATIGILTILSITPVVSANTIAVIDTPSSHYTVVDTIYNGRPIRVLSMGPSGFQSGVFLDGSHELVFGYTQRMAGLVAKAPHKDRILILGGGAFTLPDYLARAHPNIQIDVVEIDPKLVEVSQQHFFYSSPSNVHVIAQDARAYVAQSDTTYDLILVDTYSDINLPFAVTTEEYTSHLKDRLTPRGSVLVNALGANTATCAPLLGAIHHSYLHVFTQYRAFPLEEASLKLRQNIVVAYSNGSLSWADDPDWLRAQLPNGMRLTDNFAPTERLHQQCWR